MRGSYSKIYAKEFTLVDRSHPFGTVIGPH
jgi:hypothetical protein